MKLSGKAFLLLAAITATIDFIYIVARHAVATTPPGMDPFHTLLFLAAASAFTLGIRARQRAGEQNPMQIIGKALFVATALLLLIGTIELSGVVGFDAKSGYMLPESATSMIGAHVLSLIAVGTSILIFLWLTDLLFIKRRRTTRRNYVLLLAVGGVYIILHSIAARSGSGVGVWLGITAAVLVVLMIVNAFRFSWILLLSRREKLVNLLLTFFGFAFFLLLTIDSAVFSAHGAARGVFKLALMWFHPAGDAAYSTICLFGTLFMGLGFTSTLLHLPTAKEFDRKKAEISSLQNMSRLINEVFDFDELLSTTTQLALDVSECDASWIELTGGSPGGDAPGGSAPGAGADTQPRTALRNLAAEDLDSLRLADGRPLRALAFNAQKPVLVPDAQRDRRLSHERPIPAFAGSVALFPLTSHGTVIGALGLAKRTPFEFDRDAMSVLTAFADMVSVAIENSRLIEESLSRERFRQELMVARQMQRSLLPSLLPITETYDIAADSIPAYEVGGDYYDVIQLDDHRLGVVIGDVSGKGVSAALYMAQVKGIFQALGTDSLSTRDILNRMNATLCKTMDRRSFISLLYAVLDIHTGRLIFSRAGHCPLLYISGGTSQYLRPDGMGLGLDGSERFEASIEEERLDMAPGDIIVLFTDGVTEARNNDGDEFHYSRLADVVASCADADALGITGTVIRAVREFSGPVEALDDMTVLVLRWHGAPENEIHDHSKNTKALVP